MKNINIIPLLCLHTILLHADLSLSTLLYKKAHEEVARKEYTIADNGVLSLENIHGSITIKPEWNQNTIVVSTKKKASSQAMLKELRMISEQPTSSLITLRTMQDGDEKTTATLDYELIVPRNITLKLSTREGDINVSNVSGPIQATTHQGSIILDRINSVEATIKKQGSVSVLHAQGPVRVSTQKGSIKIVNPTKDVMAISMKGSIDVQCDKSPTTVNLWLKAGAGDIALALPPDINADLQAKAKGGKIVCDHEVTIKPFATKLNTQAWNRFKQEVSGVLGSKATSNKVCLYAKNGNIKVVESSKLHRVKEMTELS